MITLAPLDFIVIVLASASGMFLYEVGAQFIHELTCPHCKNGDGHG